MIDVKVHSLLLHTVVVVECDVLIFRTVSVGEDGVSPDLPQRDSQMVREYKGHPVVVNEDVVGTRKVKGAHLQKKLARDEAVVSVNKVDLHRTMDKKRRG